ncbi:hypothetical protein [Micromonospora okii]|uniref:hypothetical protein n=1 Tax=Micromonospora okii TaxID=1182970 RepID=UPI001E571AB5|nr:hypothetical protein [Micromonospora okii]
MSVRRRLLRATAGCVATTVAATALTVVGATGTAQAACTTSSFTVVWDYAGMYTQPNEGTLYGTRRYGQVVTGPTGNTSNGWTVTYDWWNGLSLWAYMKDASLQYRGCA